MVLLCSTRPSLASESNGTGCTAATAWFCATATHKWTLTAVFICLTLVETSQCASSLATKVKATSWRLHLQTRTTTVPGSPSSCA